MPFSQVVRRLEAENRSQHRKAAVVAGVVFLVACIGSASFFWDFAGAKLKVAEQSASGAQGYASPDDFAGRDHFKRFSINAFYDDKRNEIIVLEEHTVVVTGESIQRGFYRDFPLVSVTDSGKYEYEYEFLYAKRLGDDGVDVSFPVEDKYLQRLESANLLLIALANKDRLQPGTYKYRFEYKFLNAFQEDSEGKRRFRWRITRPELTENIPIDQFQVSLSYQVPPESASSPTVKVAAISIQQEEEGRLIQSLESPKNHADFSKGEIARIQLPSGALSDEEAFGFEVVL